MTPFLSVESLQRLNQNVFGETYGHHYGVRRCKQIESSIKEAMVEALEECLGNLTYQNKKNRCIGLSKTGMGQHPFP